MEDNLELGVEIRILQNGYEISDLTDRKETANGEMRQNLGFKEYQSGLSQQTLRWKHHAYLKHVLVVTVEECEDRQLREGTTYHRGFPAES